MCLAFLPLPCQIEYADYQSKQRTKGEAGVSLQSRIKTLSNCCITPPHLLSRNDPQQMMRLGHGNPHWQTLHYCAVPMHSKTKSDQRAVALCLCDLGNPAWRSTATNTELSSGGWNLHHNSPVEARPHTASCMMKGRVPHPGCAISSWGGVLPTPKCWHSRHKALSHFHATVDTLLLLFSSC